MSTRRAKYLPLASLTSSVRVVASDTNETAIVEHDGKRYRAHRFVDDGRECFGWYPWDEIDDRYQISEDRVQALASELHDDELWRGVDLDMVREALDGWRALSPEERRLAFNEGVVQPPDMDCVDPSHWDREIARLRSLPRATEDDGPELPFFDFDIENDSKAFVEKVRK